MDKRDLATIISTQTGICREDVESVLNCAFSTIKKLIAGGKKIPIRGFGTFAWKNYEAQDFTCSLPGREQTFRKPPRRVPSFAPVKSFREMVQKADKKPASPVVDRV